VHDSQRNARCCQEPHVSTAISKALPLGHPPDHLWALTFGLPTGADGELRSGALPISAAGFGGGDRNLGQIAFGLFRRGAFCEASAFARFLFATLKKYRRQRPMVLMGCLVSDGGVHGPSPRIMNAPRPRTRLLITRVSGWLIHALTRRARFVASGRRHWAIFETLQAALPEGAFHRDRDWGAYFAMDRRQPLGPRATAYEAIVFAKGPLRADPASAAVRYA